MAQTVYSEMKPGEEKAVCDLVERVFGALVAPGYDAAGAQQFFRYANPIALAERVRAGGFVLTAKRDGRLVGMVEFASPDRIALLFVSLRGQGVGKELVARAIEKARDANSALSKVTVHSSPYAEPAYQKMGFRRSGDATISQGIRYVPMELSLGDRSET